MTNYISKSKQHIINGLITKSDIDMDNGIITSHADPILPYDVANKNYVDTQISLSSGGITTLNIMLTGTTYVTAITSLKGSYNITVSSTVTNSPYAQFVAVKNDQTANLTSIDRTASRAGITTSERLIMRWLSNSNLEISKTGTGYDGQYTIKYY